VSVTLVACGSAKQDRPVPARDLYTSTLFRLSRRYAESQPCPWYVLSAEHALLDPARVTAPYDTRLGPFRGAPPIHAWTARVLDALHAAHPDLRTVMILAGHVYVDPLRRRLTAAGVTVLDPLRGLGIGHRLAWLKAHTPSPPNR